MRKNRPSIGEMRVVKRFAFLPIQTSNEWAWLETVYIKQHADGGGYTRDRYWINDEFVTHEQWLHWRGHGWRPE